MWILSACLLVSYNEMVVCYFAADFVSIRYSGLCMGDF